MAELWINRTQGTTQRNIQKPASLLFTAKCTYETIRWNGLQHSMWPPRIFPNLVLTCPVWLQWGSLGIACAAAARTGVPHMAVNRHVPRKAPHP